MAGKEIYTGVMLNTLNDNIAKLSADMLNVTNLLVAISGNTSQSVNKFKIGKGIGIKTSLNNAVKTANLTCYTHTVNYFPKEKTLSSFADGFLTFKAKGGGIASQGVGKHIGIYAKIDANYYTIFSNPAYGGSFDFDLAVDVPVVYGDVIELGFCTKANVDNAVHCIDYTIQPGDFCIEYSFKDPVIDGAFNIT